MTSLPLAACSLYSLEQVCIELRCELGDAVENVLLPATWFDGVGTNILGVPERHPCGSQSYPDSGCHMDEIHRLSERLLVQWVLASVSVQQHVA